jgi:hypothetical protein
MIIQSKELLTCPHCKKELEDNAEDYTICGKVGSESEAESDCGL